MARKVLEVRDLEVRFKTPIGVVHAVNGVSFQLHEGETLALVGESGSGKTMSTMACLQLIPDPPGYITRGEVWFDGRDLLQVTEDAIRKVRGSRIAIVPQDPTSLNPVLTIGRQLTEAMEIHLKLNRAAARRRAAELLTMVGIPGGRRRLDDYPHQLSGGMRQRVMIAIALSCSPEVLIADEPTTALDVTIQTQILELVKKVQNEAGLAMIWVTHDLGVVAGLADRVAVMYAGRIVEEGRVSQIFNNPQHPYTIGLLRSIPRSDQHHRRRLTAISGVPPDLLTLSVGCSFSDRCEYSEDVCRAETPQLVHSEEGHLTACWMAPFGLQRGETDRSDYHD